MANIDFNKSGDALDDDFAVDEKLGVTEDGVEEDEDKKRKKKKQKTAHDHSDSGIDASKIRAAKRNQVADFFRKHLLLSTPGMSLSSMQMDEAVKDEFFLHQDKSQQIMSLQDLITVMAPSASKAGKGGNGKAAPHAAVITSSAERAQEIFKEIEPLNIDNSIVRAYGNHPKVKKLLKRFLASADASKARIVVSTPGRLKSMIEDESLDPSAFKAVLIDLKQNSKTQTIMDMKVVLPLNLLPAPADPDPGWFEHFAMLERSPEK